MQVIDLSTLKQWEGRQEHLTDEMTAFPVKALKATIEAPYVGDGQKGEALPPLWHWLYFLPLHAQSSLGEDGHARKGGFLPPVPCHAECGRVEAFWLSSAVTSW